MGLWNSTRPFLTSIGWTPASLDMTKMTWPFAAVSYKEIDVEGLGFVVKFARLSNLHSLSTSPVLYADSI
jgi:hypothetical protein